MEIMDKLAFKEAVKNLLKGILLRTIIILLMICLLKIERLENELLDQRIGISLYPGAFTSIRPFYIRRLSF